MKLQYTIALKEFEYNWRIVKLENREAKPLQNIIHLLLGTEYLRPPKKLYVEALNLQCEHSEVMPVRGN